MNVRLYSSFTILFWLISLTTTVAQGEWIEFDNIFYNKKGSLKENGKVYLKIQYKLGNGDVYYINQKPDESNPAQINLHNTPLSQAVLEVTFKDDFKPNWLAKNTRLILTKPCYAGNSPDFRAKTDKPITIYSMEMDGGLLNRGEPKLKYQFVDQGKDRMTIKFNFLDIIEDFDLQKHRNECYSEVTIHYNIFGGFNPPLDSIKWVEMDKSDCYRLQQFINEFPNSRPYNLFARDSLKAVQNRYLKVCYNAKDSVACKKVLNCFPSSARADSVKLFLSNLAKSQRVVVKPDEPAKNKNTTPTRKVDIPDDRKEWRKIDGSGSIELYQAFANQFPGSIYAELARDSISRLSPFEFEKTREGKDKFKLVFKNVKNPKFKDLSFNEGLEVSDGDLRSSNTLSINLKRSGTYKILVKDEWNKEEIISFSNKINTGTIKKLDNGNYQIKLEGGKPPYALRFINTENKSPEYIEKIEESGEYTIGAELLSRLRGDEYTLEVTDINKSVPIPLDGKIVIDRNPFANPFKLILILSIVFVILMAIIIISWLRKRRKQKMVEFYK